MNRRALVPVLALAALLAFAAPVAAIAVQALSTGRPKSAVTPARITNLDVQYWPEDPTSPSGATMIVVAVLPTDTPMPAVVDMPLPAGARVTWSGEISQSSAASDTQRPFTTATPAGDVIRITTRKSRIVQYEASYPTYRTESGRRVATLTWVESAPADSTTLSFKLPLQATDVRSDPAFAGPPDVNQAGEKLYSLASRAIKQGESFKLTVNYAAAANTAEPAKTDLLLPTLFGLLAVAVIALIAVVLRQRRTAE